MGDVADLVSALLDRWHGPALGSITGINDPRPNPVTGLVAATGTWWPTPVGPARARVVTIDAGQPLEAVILAARQAVWQALRDRAEGRDG